MVAALVAIFLPTQGALGAPGDLDPSWGGDGFVVTDMSAPGSGHTTVTDVVPLPDGRTMGVGLVHNFTNWDGLAVRWNADGTLDTSFSSDGYDIIRNRFMDEQTRGAAVDSSGRLVVAGHSEKDAVADEYDLMVGRYDTSGNPDPTFGTNGVTYVSVPATTFFAFDVAIDNNGDIVVAGYALSGTYRELMLARFNPDGTPDTTFDGDGMRRLDHATGNDVARSLAIDPSNRYVVAGYSSSPLDDTMVLRFLDTGVLDPAFSGDGVEVTPISATNLDIGTDVALDVAGNVIVTGYGWNLDYDGFVARYTSAGVLDTTFHGDGWNMYDYATTQDSTTSLVIDPGGRYVIAGSTENGATDDFLTMRVNPSTGNLDTTFSGDGKQVTPILADHDTIWDIEVDSSGRYMLGGSALVDSFYDGGATAVMNSTTGALDPSWSTDGFDVLMLGTDGEYPSDIKVDSLNRVVAVGTATMGPVIGNDDGFAIARYLEDGSLDPSFSGDGMLIVDHSGNFNDDTYGMAIDSADRILVAGESAGDWGLIRLDPDGTLDTTFDGDGIVKVDMLAGWDQRAHPVIDSLGRIVLGGTCLDPGNVRYMCVARLLANGAIDTSFSGDGKVTYPAQFGVSVDVDSLDRPVLLGDPGGSTIVLRYTTAGVLDSTFSGDGIATATGTAGEVVVDSLDRVVVGGSNAGFQALRFLENGSPDTSFAGDGSVSASFGAGGHSGYGVDLMADDRVVVAGKTTLGSMEWVSVARWNVDGTLDTNFSGDGLQSVNIPRPWGIQGQSVVVDQNQRIVVHGKGSTVPGGNWVITRFLECIPPNPCTPMNQTPTHDGWAASLTPTLTASAFLDSDAGTHNGSQFQLRTNAGNWTSPLVDSGTIGSVTSWIEPTTLTEGAVYWFRVRYRDNDLNWSAWSDETRFTVDVTPPDTGSVDYPDGEQQDLPIVTFADGTDALSGVAASTTRLQRRSTTYLGGGTCDTWVGAWVDQASPNPNSPYTDATVTAGTCYQYRYRVLDVAGNVRLYTTAKTVKMIPDTTPPRVPQGRRLSDRLGTAVVIVTWDRSTDNFSAQATLDYEVESSTNGTVWTALCLVPDSNRTCQRSGLTAGQPIYFRIRAEDEAGNDSAWGYYADASNVTHYLRENVTSTYLTATSVKGISTTSGAFAATTTPNLNGNSDYWQYTPAGAAVTALGVPLGISPAAGRGWYLDAGAGSGGNPGGINDGPIVLSWTTRASKVNGTAGAFSRLFSTASSGGNPAAPTNFLTTGADGANMFGQTTDLSHVHRHAGYASPPTWQSGESLYVETWFDISVASGSSGGAMTVQMTGTPNLEMPQPGVRAATPTALSPADGTSGASAPVLGATYQHPAPTAGHLVFEVWTDSAGTPGVLTETGYSAFELAAAAAGTYTPVDLTPGTYHWRARSEDRQGRVSAWTSYRAFTITGSAGTISISVDDATPTLGALISGVDAVDSNVVTVTTTSPGGYELEAIDESDTWGANAGGLTIPDWGGTGATPTAWAGGVIGGWGITVRGATGGRLAKWGAGNGTAENDFVANDYAGLDQSVPTLLHARSSPTVGDQVTVTYRANVSAVQGSGIYDANIILTATALP